MKDENLDYAVDVWQEKVIISLRGKLNLESVSFLRKDLTKAIDGNDRPLYEFDLSKLDYMDSSGVGLLLQLHKKLEAAGKAMAFTNVNDEIMHIFKVAGLEKILSISS